LDITESSARTDKSFSHFLDISLGSPFKLGTQLLVAYHRKYIKEKLEEYRGIHNKTLRILNGYIKYLIRVEV